MVKVTLSTGQEIEVLPVPPFALAAIDTAHPVPENLSPEEARTALATRERIASEAAWLLALPDIEVPESWEFPRGLRYAGLQPREGQEGRLLDYIEYALLATHEDAEQVQRVMYGAALMEEEIAAAEATFRPDGGRETPADDPAG
jgi:hypothetical protein